MDEVTKNKYCKYISDLIVNAEKNPADYMDETDLDLMHSIAYDFHNRINEGITELEDDKVQSYLYYQILCAIQTGYLLNSANKRFCLEDIKVTSSKNNIFFRFFRFLKNRL